MAKKNQIYRKQRQSSQFLWLFLAIGGGVLLLAAILFSNRDGGGSPSITVDENQIDYGYVKFGETKQFTIQVTNNGDGALRFQEKPYIEIVEGC
jgi:hypothetical protein